MSALIACKSCGQPIARNAQRCPYCGRETVGLGGMLVGILAFFVLLAVLAGLAIMFGVYAPPA